MSQNIQTSGERCSAYTVPSSRCFGMAAPRASLQRKCLLTNLSLRLAADGASNLVFDDVSFEKLSVPEL